MVRHCAALKRGDEQAEEETANELDSLWEAHGNTAEAEWNEACLWIADCAAEWPKDHSQPKTALTGRVPKENQNERNITTRSG